MMRSRGVHILDNFPCFLTTAHSQADIDLVAKAFKESVAELQDADFLPQASRRARGAGCDQAAGRGRATGSRPIGRQPAWFVPDPEQPGKYKKVEA